MTLSTDSDRFVFSQQFSSERHPSATETQVHKPQVIVHLPAWLKFLCGLCLILMANQIVLTPLAQIPWLNGIFSKVCLPEIAFVIAFLAAGFTYLYKKLTISIPLLCLLPILLMGLANYRTGTGMSGTLETAQMTLMLIGGSILFAFMHRYMPSTTLVSATLALILNLVVAVFQDFRVGAFLTLAPQDMIALPWGFGAAMTGLFRSKIAFSLYVGTSLAWCMSQWLHVTCKTDLSRLLRDLGCLLLTTVGLLYIPHGLIALITAVILLIGGYASACHANRRIPTVAVAAMLLFATLFPDNLHVQSWKHSISLLKGYDYIPDAQVLFNQQTPHSSEEGSPNAHELKTSHYDFIAALRLAADHPETGVGSGNYQNHIGQAFSLQEDAHRAQLPNPVLNDVESDSQSGWGILLATLGIPATLAFALCFLAALGANLRRYLEDMEDGLAVHLGAAMSLAIFLLAMFLTDPLIKGLGWWFMLALASAETGPQTRKLAFMHPMNRFTAKKLIPFIVIACLAVALPLIGADRGANQADQKAEAPQEAAKPLGTASEPVAEKTYPPSPLATFVTPEPHKPAPLATFVSPQQPVEKPVASLTPKTSQEEAPAGNEEELFIVFNASHAFDVTMPMRKEADPDESFPQGLLVIPDKSGVPPPGQKPALQHGGAVFECILTHEAKVYLWFNVMWDGSCGNTLDVSVDDAPVSYTVGNDATYRTWHWQRSPKSYRLAPGKHTITVLNREDGIKLSQILMVNDKDYVPEGIEEE